jgi:transposase
MFVAMEQMTDNEQVKLQQLAASPNQERARRARIVLLSQAGRSDAEIAAELNVSRKTAWRWRIRFAELGLDGIVSERPRTGRKPKVHDQVAGRIIDTTLSVKPPEGNRWSTRRLAEFLGVSRAMVHRVWRRNGISPSNGIFPSNDIFPSNGIPFSENGDSTSNDSSPSPMS